MTCRGIQDWGLGLRGDQLDTKIEGNMELWQLGCIGLESQTVIRKKNDPWYLHGDMGGGVM